MKSYLFSLALLALGCTRYPTSNPAYDRLVNLPTISHEREIAILFPGDPPPPASYIKVGIVEAQGSQHTPYNELVRQLQTKAQTLGVDAVQVFDKDHIEDTYGSDYGINTWVTSTLAGLGILYLKNTAYLDQYVKSKEIYLYNDTTSQYDQLVCRTDLAYNDEPPKVVGDATYANFVERRTVDHLLHEETPEWTYRLDKLGRTAKRVYRPGGYLVKKCWIVYDFKGRVTEIRIRHLYPEQKKEKIQLSYDERGTLLEKQVYQEGQLAFREILTYDEHHRLVGSEYVRVRDELTNDPYLRIVYRFFNPEDLGVDASLVTTSSK